MRPTHSGSASGPTRTPVPPLTAIAAAVVCPVAHTTGHAVAPYGRLMKRNAVAAIGRTALTANSTPAARATRCRGISRMEEVVHAKPPWSGPEQLQKWPSS